MEPLLRNVCNVTGLRALSDRLSPLKFLVFTATSPWFERDLENVQSSVACSPGFVLDDLRARRQVSLHG